MSYFQSIRFKKFEVEVMVLVSKEEFEKDFHILDSLNEHYFEIVLKVLKLGCSIKNSQIVLDVFKEISRSTILTIDEAFDLYFNYLNIVNLINQK